MPLIGYARVSTEDQTPLPQSQALKSAGCAEIHEEHASGGNRARPVLARVLERVARGRHAGRRAHRPAGAVAVAFAGGNRTAGGQGRVLPVNSGPDRHRHHPQGKFTLQVLGAAAEFERALIRERTKAGLASARTKGRVGGNPGLRAKDPAALRKVRLARQDGYMERLNETAQDWVPHVRRLRPDLAWEDVLRIINSPLPEARRLDPKPPFARCEGLCPRRLPACRGAGPRRTPRNRRPPARHRRRHQGRGSRHHASGDL